MKIEKNEPLVSICCITYNHEKFIADAINGFLMQKTTFPFEIIIHDDASTDSTRDVILQYQSEYPDLIRTIFQTENQYSQGNHAFPFTFQAAKGKYLALCEGDDYWIDPYKLQKQVEFLENNPEYVACYHNYVGFWQDNSKPLYLREKEPWDTYTLADVIRCNSYYHKNKATPGQTSTAVFKKSCISSLPDWCLQAYNIDIPLFIHIARFGLSKFISCPMSAYRNYPESLSRSQTGTHLLVNRISMYKSINKDFKKKYSKLINPIISRIYLRAAVSEINKENKALSILYTVKSLIYFPRDSIYIIKKAIYTKSLMNDKVNEKM